MKFDPLNCPQCGEPAQGQVDNLTAVALFTEPDGDGKVDWEGESEVCWDDQKPVLDDQNRVTLVCPDGHEWQARSSEYKAPVAPDCNGKEPELSGGRNKDG